MNKPLGAIVAIALLSSGAMAATPPAKVELKTQSGIVTFPHPAHAKSPCKTCHADDKGGKIAGLDRDRGHALCRGCHEKEKKGPFKCTGCHKK